MSQQTKSDSDSDSHLSTASAHAVDAVQTETLEGLLARLSQYGYVRLVHFEGSDKWGCTIKMRIAVEGCNFEISAGTEYPQVYETPIEVVRECYARVLKAVGALLR
jgi:hypothetical protein